MDFLFQDGGWLGAGSNIFQYNIGYLWTPKKNHCKMIRILSHENMAEKNVTNMQEKWVPMVYLHHCIFAYMYHLFLNMYFHICTVPPSKQKLVAAQPPCCSFARH